MKNRFDLFAHALKYSSAIFQTTKKTFGSSSFPEHRVTIQTCGELYEKWRKEKRYKKVPDGSLTYEVAFIDTSETGGEKSERPTALVLHGAPGSYRDFNVMTSHLHGKGVRVIAPNFPDFTTYKPGVFRHSAEEKSQLIKDFLKEIRVPRIDLLICHSSALYPALQLCVQSDLPKVGSLALLSPGGFDTNMRAVRPYKAIQTMVWLSESSIGLKFLEIFGPFIFKLIKVPVKFDSILDPILSATAMCYGDYPQSKERLKTISSSKVPILLAFGEDDKLIDRNFSYDTAYLLGSNDNEIFLYDKNGKLIHAGIEKPLLKVMAFQEGGHYVFWKYPGIINAAISSFILKNAARKQEWPIA